MGKRVPCRASRSLTTFHKGDSNIYDRCYDVKRMRKFLERNPITKAFAEALYEYKEVQVRSGKRGLEDIVIDKDNPEVYKVDPYVASTIAAVGEMLKKGKR